VGGTTNYYPSRLHSAIILPACGMTDPTPAIHSWVLPGNIHSTHKVSFRSFGSSNCWTRFPSVSLGFKQGIQNVPLLLFKASIWIFWTTSWGFKSRCLAGSMRTRGPRNDQGSRSCVHVYPIIYLSILFLFLSYSYPIPILLLFYPFISNLIQSHPFTHPSIDPPTRPPIHPSIYPPSIHPYITYLYIYIHTYIIIYIDIDM
jgi:hypothetical protein